ncbi:hypothetical protein MPQ_1418 [Methylovorus sp. MP688]|nr:hypothetical protein MPQ_1418 [Methylovorus sp. MP688]
MNLIAMKQLSAQSRHKAVMCDIPGVFICMHSVTQSSHQRAQ